VGLTAGLGSDEMRGKPGDALDALDPGCASSAPRNDLDREQVVDIQRARILAGMLDVAAERGAGNVTVAHVVARSGVSRRTFYEIFEDREDCFLAAFDEAVGRIEAVVLPAYRRGAKWRERVRAGLTAMLELLDLEPGVGRFVIVETLGAGPQALERRQHALDRMASAIGEGSEEKERSQALPPLTAEGIAGGVLSIVHAHLVEGNPTPLVGLANPLMSMIVLPYLGPAAARKELERPVPRRSRKSNGASFNPLKGLEMRLTYRTVRVLMAIGEHPGVSNRRIAEAAGVSDQGQISKLLARLDSLSLIENSGFGQAKGESNSWYLTERGREIEQAIREQTNGRH
jgi:AcrR family transcriptional regulator/DNA-binding MarR family transcriptional regulator